MATASSSSPASRRYGTPPSGPMPWRSPIRATSRSLRSEALRHFNNLMVDDGDRFFFQPCFSPVWDTAIGAYALALADPRHESLTPAANWLLRKEIRRKGDWSIKRPNTEPSGWAFEYSNEFYPDIDDTAMVMLSLSQLQASDYAAQRAASERGLGWLLAMQSKDGGWAAFDADNNWEFLSKVPFSDHNAMLDPTCADIDRKSTRLNSSHLGISYAVFCLKKKKKKKSTEPP